MKDIENRVAGLPPVRSTRSYGQARGRAEAGAAVVVSREPSGGHDDSALLSVAARQAMAGAGAARPLADGEAALRLAQTAALSAANDPAMASASHLASLLRAARLLA